MADNDDQKTPKVVQLQTQKSVTAAAEMLKQAMPVLLQHIPLQAKMRRAAFKAYMAEGFTEKQALELCRTH